MSLSAPPSAVRMALRAFPGSRGPLIARRTRARKRKARLDWMGWLIPLALCAPYRKVGPFAVSLVEVGVIIAGLLALRHGVRRSVRGAPIGPYLIMFLTGWALATLNGLRFEIEFQLRDLVIFYPVAVAFLGWQVGYQARGSMERYSTSRVAMAAVGTALGIVVVYTVSSYSDRLALISRFAPMTPKLETACLMDRFPGLGQNPNIYGFFPVLILVFSFDSFLKKRSSILIPAMAILVVLATGSRKSFIFALVAVLVLLVFSRRELGMDEGGKRIRRRNRVMAALVLLGVGLGISRLVSHRIVSNRAIESLQNNERVALDANYRLRKWSLGFRRVAMAPILGIPRPREEVDRMNYFLAMAHPHNEFIQIWMWYGLLGLLAHVYLLSKLVSRNLRYRSGPVWYLFYGAVILQMMVDTAFKSHAWAAVFFMIAGYNWAMLKEPKAEVVGRLGGQPALGEMGRRGRL